MIMNKKRTAQKARTPSEFSASSRQNSHRTHQPKKNNQNSAQGQVRIIGGDWRGRKLPVLLSEGLRPTSDRVRETVFNWFQFDVPGARCLDLFAGSGALGLEALSRGAGFVQFVEFSPKVAAQLQQNLQTLTVPAQRAKLSQADALLWLDRPVEKAFELVFLDPPFHKDLLPKVLQKLFDNGYVDSKSIVYLEQEKSQDLPSLPAGWELQKEKTTSQVRYGYYIFNSD